MDFSAKHIDFVLACYAISAVVLLAMTLIVMYNARKNDRQLARLEQALGRKKAKTNEQ